MRILVSLCLIIYCCISQAVEYTFEDIEFTSHNTKLAGTMVYRGNAELKAAVVFVHGSGKQKRSLEIAKNFAKDGIAAMVYDKRGVGQSGGEYERKQSVSETNLSLLADDAAAAVNVLAKHPKTRNLPIGLTGISQAGWIVPISSTRNNEVDFIVLWSGPVCKVSEEDIFSKFTRDRDTGAVPSFDSALAERTTPYVWPDFLGKDTNPMDDLANLQIPGLWIFGAQDGSVPTDLSMLNLDKLRQQAHKYEYVLFSNSGHNNMTESFALVNHWILQQSR